jgi:hypothetical protein
MKNFITAPVCLICLVAFTRFPLCWFIQHAVKCRNKIFIFLSMLYTKSIMTIMIQHLTSYNLWQSTAKMTKEFRFIRKVFTEKGFKGHDVCLWYYKKLSVTRSISWIVNCKIWQKGPLLNWCHPDILLEKLRKTMQTAYGVANDPAQDRERAWMT